MTQTTAGVPAALARYLARGPEVLARYSSLVDPGRPIPRETTQLTGIDDAMIAGAPPIERVVREAAEVIGARDLVAHHASFDRCLLYTSDAADDLLCVDLGGR